MTFWIGASDVYLYFSALDLIASLMWKSLETENIRAFASLIWTAILCWAWGKIDSTASVNTRYVSSVDIFLRMAWISQDLNIQGSETYTVIKFKAWPGLAILQSEEILSTGSMVLKAMFPQGGKITINYARDHLVDCGKPFLNLTEIWWDQIWKPWRAEQMTDFLQGRYQNFRHHKLRYTTTLLLLFRHTDTAPNKDVILCIRKKLHSA